VLKAKPWGLIRQDDQGIAISRVGKHRGKTDAGIKQGDEDNKNSHGNSFTGFDE
jgi:hypothetical protein